MLGVMFGQASASGRGDEVRLPRSGQYRVLQGPLGGLVFRPWFDRLALRFICRTYLPLSRGWAAAQAAGLDPEAFQAQLPGRHLPHGLLAAALGRVARRRAASEAAARRWEILFFGPQDPGAAALVAAESARHRAAHRHMASRSAFVPWLSRLPPVRWQVAGPAEVETRHALRLGNPEAAYPVPDRQPLEASRPVRGPWGREQWLRYRSPVIGDRAWARVLTPDGVSDPPTLISLHGVVMENEMWRGAVDPVTSDGPRGTGAGGLRIIWPEGPWHGRRRLEGWYGGEPVMGRGPIGLLDFFEAWVGEVALLIRWARETSRGPVALGGVSLGALTGQLVATAAQHWPAELGPDALYLVATSGDLMAVARDGGLSRALALRPQLEARGWSDQGLTRWLSLIEPRGRPVLPAARIVMVIGARDEVAPFEGGLALARAWGLPEANLFIRDQGHFSVSLGLLRNRAPLRHLAGILARLR